MSQSTLQLSVLFAASEQAGRDYQQDRFAVLTNEQEQACWLVVADGVGGSERGERAAQLVCDQAATLWQQRARFADGESLLFALIHSANQQIATLLNSPPSSKVDGDRALDDSQANVSHNKRSATTVATLVFRDSKVCVSHAGDSRVYHIRNGEIINVTADHSLAYVKFKMGEITKSQWASHPSQNQLLWCLDGRDELNLLDYQYWPVEPEDYFVLCTDGSWEVFDDQALVALCENPNRRFVWANGIEERVQQQPRHDNSTIIIAQYLDLPSLPATASPVQQSTDPNHEQPSATFGDDDVSRALPATSGKMSNYARILTFAVLLLVALGLIAYLGCQQQWWCAAPHAVAGNTAANEQPANRQPHSNESQSSEPDATTPTEMPSTSENTERSGTVSDNLMAELLPIYKQVLSVADAEQADVALLAIVQYLQASHSLDARSELRVVDGQDRTEGSDGIVTLQQWYNGVPVFGALLKYRVTNGGVELLGGQTTVLDTVPSEPHHEFAACFAQYQQHQQAEAGAFAASIDEIQVAAAPQLYIDPASEQYFWLVAITRGQLPMQLHLSDIDCSALREVSGHVHQ